QCGLPTVLTSSLPHRTSRLFQSTFKMKMYWRPWMKFRESSGKLFSWRMFRSSLTRKSRRAWYSIGYGDVPVEPGAKATASKTPDVRQCERCKQEDTRGRLL